MLKQLRKLVAGEVRPIGGEGPRGYVGGLWHEISDLQFRFLVDQGLRPEHILLDIACGSLRGGVRTIPYLETGNYLGIDIKQDLIDHGIQNEIGATLNDIKRPEFVVSGDFEFGRFSKRPDFAIAQSLFTHLVPDDIRKCLINLRGWRNDGTRLFATFFEVETDAGNPSVSHPHDAFRYTRQFMEALGRECGWKMRYIGAWKHPRDQKMLEFWVE